MISRGTWFHLISLGGKCKQTRDWCTATVCFRNALRREKSQLTTCMRVCVAVTSVVEFGSDVTISVATYVFMFMWSICVNLTGMELDVWRWLAGHQSCPVKLKTVSRGLISAHLEHMGQVDIVEWIYLEKKQGALTLQLFPGTQMSLEVHCTLTNKT